MKRMAAYCRVSTKKEEQIDSLEHQKAFFEEYARQNQYELIAIYADEGKSGTKLKKRTEFLKMLQDAKKHAFDVLVVKDISRMARNTLDFLESFRELKQLGIETRFANSNLSSTDSEFTLTILAAIAQEESANISAKVKFGKSINARRGRIPNLTYGYDKIPGDYFNLSINESEAAIIRQIFEWYVRDGYGSSQIAAMLNARGILTKRRSRWGQKAVCRILQNPIYTGLIINGKQQVSDFLTSKRETKSPDKWYRTQNENLRILDNGIFWKAQELLKQRNQAFRVNHIRQSNKYLFSTLIYCKNCGYSFRRLARQRTYGSYIRWVCSGRNSAGADSCKNTVKIDEDELIDVLQQYFVQILSAQDMILQRMQESIERSVMQSDNGDKLKKLIVERDKLKNRKNRFVELYADGLLSRAELEEKVGDSAERLQKLEAQITVLQRTEADWELMKAQIQQMFMKIEDIVDVRSMTNAQLKEIVKRIEVSADGTVDIQLHCLSDMSKLF